MGKPVKKKQALQYEVVIHDKKEVARTERDVRQAEKELARIRERLQKARAAEHQACERAALLRKGARDERSAEARRRADRARATAQKGVVKRRALRSEEHAKLAILREAQAICKATRQRSNARQKAVRDFVARWEREYSKKILQRKKNARLRKEWEAPESQR